ncbi:MAG TPA: c-type cytochrome [Xanthomonadales bacterium]|nr:c-type cytochrome [Xanthomonadales bacterium]
MRFSFSLAASALLALSTTALAQTAPEGDAQAGQAGSAICSACHGADGNSMVPQWPNIAGQHEEYLVRQITLIKDNARPVPEMMAIVAGLSDSDIRNLAAYYSSQTPKVGVADEALVETGARVYKAGNADTGVPACMACHGPAGAGNPLAGYPMLAGQHSVYTASMLNRFRDGEHWGDGDASSMVMVGVANRLTDEEIEAVASYIQGLYKAE